MRFSVSADMIYHFACPSKVLLLLEAVNGGDQTVTDESLIVSGGAHVTRLDDPGTGEKRVAFDASDIHEIHYRATVDVAERDAELEGTVAHPLEELPPDALRYLLPSRYCPSDRFERFANREFGKLAGGNRVLGILDWLSSHLDYCAGVSDAATTALDTFVDRAGVCRDFTHLAISLCRASQIPARAVSAYGFLLDPPDMHAVFEVYLGGRWRLADPTGKVSPDGIVRVASGLDAADIAFMSIFGEAQVIEQAFAVKRL